jgi:hypothetical protein
MVIDYEDPCGVLFAHSSGCMLRFQILAEGLT